MQSAEIREKFLRFFSQTGHQMVPSSPLVPAADPTLLFTNAGMVQFKDVFLGLEQRSYQRAVSVQKCMRAGGKHNDLDQVGRTARHQTFFEMLGNFSFGDYFKRDAISFAWRFLTEELAIPPRILWITVYEEDEEAAELWREIAGIPEARIVKMGAKDNFWAMGDTGPCGPCSEIFVDRGEAYRCGPDCGLGLCECDRYQEIWNLVFMQFNRGADGTLSPLPRPSIDTGMGLERVTAFLEGVDSNFDTDLLRPLIDEVAEMSGRPYDRGESGLPFRVIADHIRAITFLLAEGVSFSNADRGYVMRRILRRAMRFGWELGFKGPFLHRLVPTVGDIMGVAYPEVLRGQDVLVELVRQEEERFMLTLSTGIKVLEEKLAPLQSGDTLSGQDAFMLYDTFGFPLDLCQDVAARRGIRVDAQGFAEQMERQRERARSGRRATAEALPVRDAVEFVGYDRVAVDDARVGALYLESDPVNRLEAGQSGYLWMARTPFYAESGGQVADNGWIVGPNGRFWVSDVVRVQGSTWHVGEVTQGFIAVGDGVSAEVEQERRQAAMRNHTGTHLLHAALRRVLGEGVHQTGSLVAPDRLRFDFSHPRALSPDEIASVERWVNRWIMEDLPVQTEEKTKERALAEGALAFFGDKYGERVRVVAVAEASRELCGGTHCRRTGEIGSFMVVNETGISAGSRRIEAATGWNALAFAQSRSQIVKGLAERLKSTPEESLDKVDELLAKVRDLNAELDEFRRSQNENIGRELAARAVKQGGIDSVVAEVPADGMESLRQVLDGMKASVDLAVLAARHGEKASCVVYANPAMVSSGLNAVDWIRRLAPKISGGGGGQAGLAQAGGKNANGIAPLLQLARQLVDQWTTGAVANPEVHWQDS